MSSFVERYIDNPMGRTVLLSGLFAAIFLYLSFLLPLAPADNDAWYSFLYKDINLEPEDRFNWILVLLEAGILSIFYLFLVILFGSYAEIQNRLPSWGEIFLAVVATLLLSWLIPQVSVGEGTITEIRGSGYNHFTKKMRTATFFITVAGVILMSFYLYFTSPKEE